MAFDFQMCINGSIFSFPAIYRSLINYNVTIGCRMNLTLPIEHHVLALIVFVLNTNWEIQPDTLNDIFLSLQHSFTHSKNAL